MSEFSEHVSTVTEENHSALNTKKEAVIAPNQQDTRSIPLRKDFLQPVPLSFAQERLWFLEQLVPGNAIYTIPLMAHISGQLDINILKQSLNEIRQRHEALRTHFTTLAGSPVQVIVPNHLNSLHIVDLSELPQGVVRDTEMQRQAHEEAMYPFDLSHPPLLRTTLLRLSKTEYVLLVTMHHSIADERSIDIYSQELTALYTAFASGQPSPLPALPIQYADFVLWQRAWLQGKVLADLLAYWQQQLSEIPDGLELPSDRPRPPLSTFRGATISFLLTDLLSSKVRTLTQQEGVPLHTFLLASFKILLYRYTQQEDSVVGLPSTGRNRSEIEPLIGFFVNMLVLRTDLSGNPSFLQVLRRVHENVQEAYAHQDLPFERLIAALQLEHNISRTPLFQVVFKFQHASLSPTETTGVGINFQQYDNQTAQFDLECGIIETDESLRCSFRYSRDLFEPDTIRRLSEHFQILLEGLVAHPERHIADVPLLSQAERQQILIDWNQTARPQQSQKLHCLHERFAAQAHHTPEAVAVMFGQEQVCYEQLNQRANQLAHYLRSLGVGPETLVGLCVERSLEMIVGILGILKAGGAYVPLDPAYPQERLAFMLQDTQVPVLVTQERLQDALPAHHAITICLDRDWTEIANQAEEAPESGVTPANLAYVIYTSGSTGKPKGVLIEHRAASNFITSTIELFAVSPADRVLQFASFCFDVSVFEIFTALLSGARLCLVRHETRLSPPALAELMREQSITIIDIPPTVLNILPADAFPDLRIVFVGGESFSGDLVNQWALPGRRFFNGYGPTEATVTMILMECKGIWHQSPPIGRPMPNHHAYILDRSLNPVPIGIPGELHVSGLGLARAYLNRPDLTAEKFITKVFDASPGIRLYKTGDLVRYLPDGNIEFLGRVDGQVKIRGFRIEPGEIEAVLLQHPAIQQAVVTVHDYGSGDRRLITYIVLEHAQQQSSVPTNESLRSFLHQHLPEHMIPSLFVPVESLPLTPSGKIDWKALPLLNGAALASTTTYVAPRTSREQKLCGIWCQILKREQIGVHDNFFTLGGHSLLATQVISSISKLFKVDIPMRKLFEEPTIAGLTTVIEQSMLAKVSPKKFATLLARMEETHHD